jgi:hypothetical protein
MRLSFATLLAAAALGAAAASIPSAQAAPLQPAFASDAAVGNVELVRDRRGHDDDRWRNRHHRRHHHNRRDRGFSFGFPYSSVPQAYYGRPYQPYYGYGDCFRTWDGQLICR